MFKMNNVKDKRVIVLGATGSLGTHIAIHMKKCGYEVVAVGHHRSDNGFYSDYGIDYLTMDISNAKEFEKLPQDNVLKAKRRNRKEMITRKENIYRYAKQ